MTCKNCTAQDFESPYRPKALLWPTPTPDHPPPAGRTSAVSRPPQTNTRSPVPSAGHVRRSSGRLMTWTRRIWLNALAYDKRRCILIYSTLHVLFCMFQKEAFELKPQWFLVTFFRATDEPIKPAASAQVPFSTLRIRSSIKSSWCEAETSPATWRLSVTSTAPPKKKDTKEYQRH